MSLDLNERLTGCCSERTDRGVQRVPAGDLDNRQPRSVLTSGSQADRPIHFNIQVVLGLRGATVHDWQR